MEKHVTANIDIKQFVKRLISIVRSNGMYNNVNIVAFIILLKKEDLLDHIKLKIYDRNTYYNSLSATKDILNVIENKTKKEILFEITEIFSLELMGLKNETLLYIIELFDEIERNFFKNHACQFLEELFLQIEDNNRLQSETNQPIEITKLVASLAEYKEGMTIYDPFAGNASYGLELKARTNYFAQEIDPINWALGIIGLLLKEIDISNVKIEDSTFYWKAEDKKFDLIVATPPFGRRLDHPAPFGYNDGRLFSKSLEIRTYDEYFLTRGIEGLNDNGKLLGVFSSSILFRSGYEQKLRKDIIDLDILEMVILLPAKLFNRTSIATTILLINKDKRAKGVVKMIDASSFIQVIDKQKRLQLDELISTINSNEDTEFKIEVQNNEIAENDYNLSLKRFIDTRKENITIPEGFEVYKLGDLVSVYKGRKNTESKGRMVKISDLSSDNLNFEKNSVDFDKNSLPSVCQKIDTNVLILSKIRALKPTYINYTENEPVYINNNVVTFTVDNSKIEIGYLIYELNSDRVTKFVSNRQSGVTMPTLSIKDIIDIPIWVPRLELQREIFNNELKNNQTLRIKELGLELDELKNSLKNEYEKKIRFRKHAIGQEIFDLKNSFNSLMKFKTQNNGILSDDMIINPLSQISIKNTFHSIGNTIDLINGMIKNIAEDYFYGEDEEIEVLSFLEDYCKNNIGQKFQMEFSHSYKIAEEDEYMPDIVDVYDEDGNFVNFTNTGKMILIAGKGDIIGPPKIKISSESFRQILANIKNNAIKHGFTSKERTDYKIAIHVSNDNGNVKISISNNGNPLKQGMNQDSFFINDRQGNVEIKNRVEHAGGKVALEADPNAEFTVKVIITFKDSSIVASF